ncbi:YbhN family protein [Tateyamaria armeniaca]|uniref:YbhN family protein n=1 Tax=Tateyamaria armeniaca TaxID=2518930 RepID=A0ABW8UXD6_9RHOB
MKAWVKVSASAGCLAALLWWSDTTEVVQLLQDVDTTWVALSVLALTIATFSMASRWKIAAAAFDIHLSFPVALREYYLAQLINTVLPGGVVGDVTRAVRARTGSDLTRAAQSVMAERLLGQIAILGVMGAGFAVALLVPGGPEWAGLGWWVLVILIGGAAIAWQVAKRDTATGHFTRLVLRLMRQPAMILHGAITTASLILGFYACARATGVTIPIEALATLIPLVLCAMLIPLSVGGWGWREGAAAALFPIIGAPASAGIATGITYGVVVLVAALPAVAILLFQSFSENLSSKGKPDIP